MKLKLIFLKNRLFFEFISISFAVFLALVVNQCRDNYNHRKSAEQSVANIHDEVLQNKKLMLAIIKEHQKFLALADSLSLDTDNELNDSEDSTIHMNFTLLNATSWETAKLTQSISYMDVNLVNKISKIYLFQDYYQTFTKDFILKNITSRTLDEEYLAYIQQLLSSIIPIEEELVKHYDLLLENIEKSS